MKAWQTLLPPPRPLRRRGVRLDNVALVPGNLLPELATYQALANRLPAGTVLVVIPPDEGTTRQALVRAAAGFRATGKRVTTLTPTITSPDPSP